jgi:N-acetylglucosaminyl-diphospho-decaprenol L-rhamnosyltransferase
MAVARAETSTHVNVPVSELSVVIVSYNSRADLQRSLPAVVDGDREVIVVDNASTDGSQSFVRERFSSVRLIELQENIGFGAACNEGLAAAGAPLVLLLNPDAWPLDDGIERLTSCASRRPSLGAVGPQVHDVHGAQQPTLVGLPTRWWTGRPAITSRPSRAIGQRVARSSPGGYFLVGAALLLRREALDQVGVFDPAFFMFYEEVDLCRRLEEAGWEIDVCSGSRFVHVGGTSTQQDWPPMYREQLRGHLRFLAKHDGLETAEGARRYLVWAVRARMLAAAGEQRRAYRDAARWLGSGHAALLLDDRGHRTPDRIAEPEDRTSETER